MGQFKSKSDGTPDRLSKTRALNASILTFVFIFVVIIWGIHALWAIKLLYNKTYGNFLNNLILGLGTLIANIAITFKLMAFLNEKILGENIDADHKKYI